MSEWRTCRMCNGDLFDDDHHWFVDEDMPLCTNEGVSAQPSALVAGMRVRDADGTQLTCVAGSCAETVRLGTRGDYGIENIAGLTVTRLHPEAREGNTEHCSADCARDRGHDGPCRPWRTLEEGPRDGDRRWVWEWREPGAGWGEAIPWTDPTAVGDVAMVRDLEWPLDQVVYAPARPTHVPGSVAKTVEGPRACDDCGALGEHQPGCVPAALDQGRLRHACCNHPVDAKGDTTRWDHYPACPETFGGHLENQQGGIARLDLKPPQRGPTTVDFSDDYDLLPDASDAERFGPRALPTAREVD